MRHGAPEPAPRIEAVLFDLGNVLIDWNPRYLYRKLFDGDEAAMEHFLANVCSAAWNHEMDAGRPVREAVRELQQRHPEQRRLIAAWETRWEETLGAAIEPSVALLGALRERGLRVCALTNWSAETFPVARRRFAFLDWFETIVVSGEVGLAKPDPAIFRLALQRCNLQAERTVFIDDSAANVAAAHALGLVPVRFRDAGQVATALRGLGVLDG